jgi:hypothetical protein
MALEVSGAPRPVASAGYNFVRWFAGVIAPYAAPKIAEFAGHETTFVVAAITALFGIAVLWLRRGTLGRFARAEVPPTEEEVATGEGAV